MIKKYYVVYVIGTKFEKGIFECDEIKNANLKEAHDNIKGQIMAVNYRAYNVGPQSIGIISWQEL